MVGDIQQLQPIFEAGSFAAVLFVWREVVALRNEVTSKHLEFDGRISEIEKRVDFYGKIY